MASAFMAKETSNDIVVKPTAYGEMAKSISMKHQHESVAWHQAAMSAAKAAKKIMYVAYRQQAMAASSAAWQANGRNGIKAMASSSN